MLCAVGDVQYKTREILGLQKRPLLPIFMRLVKITTTYLMSQSSNNLQLDYTRDLCYLSPCDWWQSPLRHVAKLYAVGDAECKITTCTTKEAYVTYLHSNHVVKIVTASRRKAMRKRWCAVQNIGITLIWRLFEPTAIWNLYSINPTLLLTISTKWS